jgi:N-acetylneuraminate synthase
MYGSDQAASVEPAGFRQMVGAVRKIEKALGDGSLEMNPKEIPVAKKLRAHLAWESDSLEGTVYQSKRP